MAVAVVGGGDGGGGDGSTLLRYANDIIYFIAVFLLETVKVITYGKYVETRSKQESWLSPEAHVYSFM